MPNTTYSFHSVPPVEPVKKTAVIAGVITLVVIVLVASVLVAYYSSVILNGSIREAGVVIYRDLNCTQPLQSVDAGIVDPGDTKNWTIYVRSKLDTAIGLNLQTSNWDPSTANGQIQLTWDYDGRRFGSNQTLEVTLTLIISYALHDVSTFSFDAWIVVVPDMAADWGRSRTIQLTGITREGYAVAGSARYLVWKSGPTTIATDALNGSVIQSNLDASKVLQYTLNSLLTVGGKIYVKDATYVLSSQIIIPRSPNWNDEIIIEGPAEFQINASVAFFLSGMRRIAFRDLNVEFLGDNQTFLRTERDEDSYSVFRSDFTNLSFDTAAKKGLVVLDLADAFQVNGENIHFGQLDGNSIALHLTCTNPTNHGDSTFTHVSCTRVGESTFLLLEGIVGGRQHDVFYSLFGYDTVNVKTYAIQLHRASRETFIAPQLEFVNAFFIDSDSDMNQIFGEGTNVNVLNYGTNTRLNGGNYGVIDVESGSVQMTGVNWVSQLILKSTTDIEGLFAMGNPPLIFNDPLIHIGTMGGNDFISVTGASASPTAPVFPSAGTGSLLSPSWKNRVELVITLPEGTSVGTYYFGFYNYWCTNGNMLVYSSVKQWDGGDSAIDYIQIGNVRDYGSNTVLVTLKVLANLDRDQTVRIFAEIH